MTKLYLSALGTNYSDLTSKSIYTSRYILESYFYITKAINNKQYIADVLDYNKRDRLLLDSGAFSFMNGKQVTEKEMDQYCINYVEFIKKYNIKYFVEMDIDAIFGYEKALEYRRYIEKECGSQAIPIFHKERGINVYKQMVSEYEYAGIGGIAMKNIKPSEHKYFRELNKYANYYGTKLHAMGFTPTRDLNSYGFYSVDSSSWASGVRFGTIYYYQNQIIRGLPRPKGTRIKLTRKEIQNHNWLEWCKYQRAVDK